MSRFKAPCLLVLMLAGTFLATVYPAEPPDTMSPESAVLTAKKMMMKCQDKGYPLPQMLLLKSIFNSSLLPAGARTANQSFLSTFLSVLNAVTADTSKDPQSQLTQALDFMRNKMWNCSNLPAVIRLMKNSSDQSVCYMEALAAPLSWATLKAQGENSFDSTDFTTLLRAAQPVLRDVPSERMSLPSRVEGENMQTMMDVLQEVYDYMAVEQRTEVLKWAKEQIIQNKFNCTLNPSAGSKTKTGCKLNLKWLDSEALSMMGPFIANLQQSDVEASTNETLCDFFLSGHFNTPARMNPSLAKTFLQKLQQCFSGKDFQKHVDKLGPLACYYDAPNLTPDLSQKLLSQLDDCEGPFTEKLKKLLINSLLSNSKDGPVLRHLGKSVTLLSAKQLSELPANEIKDLLQNLSSSVRWTRSQLRTLAQKHLGDKKCGSRVSGQELMSLQSVAAGLPSCILKNVNAQEALKDTDALQIISQQMRKGQLKAMLEGLSKNVKPSELLEKLSGPLLRAISLSDLDKANVTSFEQVENKTWSLPQAAYLAKKMHSLKQLKFRRLNSVVQGVTCKMMEEVNDSLALNTAQALAGAPQWLSKVQAQCAAQKLFMALEKERSGYFKSITEQELDMIPTVLLLHLPPAAVKVLPVSVCGVFLQKMQTADLSSVPLKAPSRPALTEKALLCVANGRNLSALSSADVAQLGALLCEMEPSRLRLLAPDVLKFSLLAMASCRHIPQHSQDDVIELLHQSFGSPSDWSAETMEALGPLLLKDENSTAALPDQPWMKDVLDFLSSRLTRVSDAVSKRLFEIVTSTSSPARRRRAVASVSNSVKPTQSLIEELGPNNVFWSAAQLEMISSSTFLATVEILGSVTRYDPDQLEVLRLKATQAFGSVAQMDESDVLRLGCITQGFSNSELEQLPLSLDSLGDIAVCGWNQSQVMSVWTAVAVRNNLTAPLLGAAEMVELDRFICALNSSEISQLGPDAFREAVGSMDALQCPPQTLEQFKQLAVSVFGNPSNWTEAQVSDLKNIVAGLNASEMSLLDPSVFSFISSASISLIPPQNFAALSVAQLEALGPDNAAMLSKEQRGSLSSDQLAALDKAVTGGSGDQSDPSQGQTTESGAPDPSAEGVHGLMKPVLILLIGLLLL